MINGKVVTLENKERLFLLKFVNREIKKAKQGNASIGKLTMLFDLQAKLSKERRIRMKNKDSTVYEPSPKPSKGDVWNDVIEDMKARREMGIEKYGTPLQPNNGRDALVDAYQEVLDLAVYLKQKIIENREE